MEPSDVSRPRMVDIVVASEHLRNRLHSEQPPMIKDRRYHLRIYQACFVGRDLLGWLVEHLEASNRNVALKCMRVLQENGIIHHVCDDHQFKDQMLYYRFRRDDGTGFFGQESEIVFRGLDLYHRILSFPKQFLLQDIQSNDRIFKTCFVGRRFVDWLIANGEARSRDDGIQVGVLLLRTGLIKQLPTGNHFQDNELYYQFVIEDLKCLKLMDVLNVNEATTKRNPTPIRPTKDPSSFYDDMANLEINKSKEMNRRRHSSFETPPQTPPSPLGDSPLTPRSVVLRNVSVEELEDRRNPYVMTKISVLRDAVGYGFVVRGSTPVYVQTVDPNGPAAAVGVKVRQYVYSVNGKNVLRWSHHQVAEEILNSPRIVELVVMNHFRGS